MPAFKNNAAGNRPGAVFIAEATVIRSDMEDSITRLARSMADLKAKAEIVRGLGPDEYDGEDAAIMEDLKQSMILGGPSVHSSEDKVINIYGLDDLKALALALDFSVVEAE